MGDTLSAELKSALGAPDPAAGGGGGRAAAWKAGPADIQRISDWTQGQLSSIGAREQAVAARMESMREPSYHEGPAPALTQTTDPVQAFGQPAMWLAIFGSMLTRRPLSTAVLGMGSVLQSTSAQDASLSQRAYQEWRANTDHALRLYEGELKAYEAGLTKGSVELRQFDREKYEIMRTAAAAYRNPVLAQVLDTHGMTGAEGLVKTYRQQYDAMKGAHDAVDTHLQGHVARVPARATAAAASTTEAPSAQAAQPAKTTTRPPEEVLADAYHSTDPAIQAQGVELDMKHRRAAMADKKASQDFKTKTRSDLLSLADVRRKLLSGDQAQVDEARRQLVKITDTPAGSLGKVLSPTASQAAERDVETQTQAEFQAMHGRTPTEADKEEMAGLRQRARLAAKGQDADPNDPTVLAAAKSIAEYRLPPLSGWVMKSKWGQAVFSQITQQNPNYNEATYHAIRDTVDKFATGVPASQIRFLNNAVGHMDTLSQLAEAQKNGDVRMLNDLYRTIASQLGVPAPTSYDAAAHLVGNEIIKSVVNSGGGQAERQEASTTLSGDLSPAQITGPKGVIVTMQKILGRQMADLRLQYESIVPTGKGFPSFDSKVPDDVRRFLKTAPISTKAGEAQSDPSTERSVPAAAIAAWGQYEPDKYDYRFSPDSGRLQRALQEPR